MFINRCLKCTVHLKIFLRLNKGGAIECIYYISYKMYVHVCEEYVPEHKLNPLRMQGTVHATILNLLCVFQMVTSCGMKALFGLFSGTPKPTTLNAELNAQIITVSETAKLYTAFDLLKFQLINFLQSLPNLVWKCLPVSYLQYYMASCQSLFGSIFRLCMIINHQIMMFSP